MQHSNIVLAMLGLVASSGTAQNVFFGSIRYGGGQDAIYSMKLDGGGLHDIRPGSSLPSGMAVDGRAGLVFWKDTISGGQYTLHSANLNGGSPSVVATWTSPTSMAYGVAVDDVNRQVYWTSLQGVHRSNYDGTGAMQVVSSFNAEDVEVDPIAGRVFWVDGPGGQNGSGVSIRSANLNGTGQQTLLTVPASTLVSGLTLDPGSQTIFWSDYGGGTISRLTYGGTALSPLVTGTPGLAGLDYEPVTDRLYIVDRYDSEVAWMPSTGGAMTTVYAGAGEMWDLATTVPTPGAACVLVALSLHRRRR